MYPTDFNVSRNRLKSIIERVRNVRNEGEYLNEVWPAERPLHAIRSIHELVRYWGIDISTNEIISVMCRLNKSLNLANKSLILMMNLTNLQIPI